MPDFIRGAGRGVLWPLRSVLERGFGARLNPLNHLGALTIYFCWIVVVSGIWLLVFFRTSVDGAYDSVEYLTHEQWYLGGVMRSLHRYASDAAIVTLLLHMVSEFAHDRYRGARWFSWVTGVPLLWLIIPLGITGYWLVWDQLAWYVALTSAELLDALPIFTVSMAGNFLSDAALSDRFFTLMAFLHLIGLPLFLVFGIWLHVFRLNGPRINPPRMLMATSLAALVVLSLVFPALSQGEVNMERIPADLGLDWFYLPVYPLAMVWSPGGVWALLVGFSLVLCMLPWLPPDRGRSAARVDLDNCNGCARCADDCPFGAITMEPRSDGKAYETEAVVDPALCVSCGLCTGACPTATPFRRQTELIAGIEQPELTSAVLRQRIIEAAQSLRGSGRMLVFGCADDPAWRRQKRDLADLSTATVDIHCMGQLPPSFIDFVLSRDLADGVVLAGCPGGDCHYRFGAEWTALRIAGERDPRLRQRVDRARLALAWQAPWNRIRRVSSIVDRLWNNLMGQRPRDATRAGKTSKPNWVLVTLACAAFLAPLGVFSIWPRYPLIAADRAMVSVSFSYAGERVGECRQLTQEELNQLPPNMRKPVDCPRERFPIRVLLTGDGKTLYDAVLPPAGLWNDGHADVYRRVPVETGLRTLFVGVNARGEAEGFDQELSRTLDLQAGQHVVVKFDDVEQQLVLVTE